MKYGILVLPGTWSERDCYHAVSKTLGQEASYIWHKDTDLSGYDCLILPGGFSYGDYLRPGAIARFSPVMAAVERFAEQGGLVIGICNGFQVLCEAGLLPGVLMRNNHLQYRCQWVQLRVENAALPFTTRCQKGQLLCMPVSHYEGSYYVEEAALNALEAGNQVALRYCDSKGEASQEANPNGSLHNIAGIVNREGNVMGMMPHPERACEQILSGEDGRFIFKSIMAWVATKR